MRISDWSSDVCSSDLVHIRRLRAAVFLHHRGITREGTEHLFRDLAGLHIAEIGRASCRERVCQYVSISVVAVSLKKIPDVINYTHKRITQLMTITTIEYSINSIHQIIFQTRIK